MSSKSGIGFDGQENYLLFPWRVDKREEMAFDGETGSEYPVLVDEMYPHEDHPVQIASLDLAETVEYVNGLELLLRTILSKWRNFIALDSRTPSTWIHMSKPMQEAEEFLELNAYAYAHQRILERRNKENG